MGVKEKDGMDRLLFIVDKRRREERYALSQCFGIFRRTNETRNLETESRKSKEGFIHTAVREDIRIIRIDRQ